MNTEPSSGAGAFSQFQLIGGMEHDPADTFLLIEPGGTMQARKGALYIAAEVAGEPALGGEACQMVLGTIAREYYEDTHPTVTTALTEALNSANQELIKFNRQALTADLPPGMPRKMRVGLTAAVAKSGQLYLCQLKPSLALFANDGMLDTLPRPRHWPEEAPQLSSDGVLMPNLYQGASLGTGPAVEVDFSHRRFSGDSLLVLCSSNLAPLLDPAESREWLTGRPANAVVEYLRNLARSHGLNEAHAVAIDALGGGNGRRSTGLVYLNAPRVRGQVAADRGQRAQGREDREQGAGNREQSATAPNIAPPTREDRVVYTPSRTRTYAIDEDWEAANPTPRPQHQDPTDAPLPAYLRGRPPLASTGSEGTTVQPSGDPIQYDAPQPQFDDLAPTSGETRGRVSDGMSMAGRVAAPVVGMAGKLMGLAGKKTLGATGTVLQHTLPENVAQRRPSSVADEAPVDEDEYEEYEDDEDEPLESHSTVLGTGYGSSMAERNSPAIARPMWLRWVLPLVAVVLLGVLVFAIQQVLSGQQAAKIDGFLAQAQQEETLGNATGDTAERRQHYLTAQDHVAEALLIQSDSVQAKELGVRIQQELDDLDNVKRLKNLTLLADLSQPPVAATVALSSTAALSGTAVVEAAGTPISGTATLSPAASDASGDYLSQILVRGDDIFLLDRGSGRLYRYSLANKSYTTILSPGDSVEQVGDATTPATVGQLLYVTWRPTAEGGDLAVIDKTYQVFIQQPDGAWQAFKLGGSDGYDSPQDLGAYDGNLYLLRGRAGQITKWAAGAYEQTGVDWLVETAANEIRPHNPISMVIDGAIHVLLGNGQIVSLEAGEIERTTVLKVWPPMDSPRSLFTSETAKSFYMVEVSDMRIIRVDKETGVVQGQLKAPTELEDAFSGLRNVFVDETAGKLYILSGKRLYTADLPPVGATPPAAPTPTLRPVEANP